jgi:hypothetical protein
VNAHRQKRKKKFGNALLLISFFSFPGRLVLVGGTQMTASVELEVNRALETLNGMKTCFALPW